MTFSHLRGNTMARSVWIGEFVGQLVGEYIIIFENVLFNEFHGFGKRYRGQCRFGRGVGDVEVF